MRRPPLSNLHVGVQFQELETNDGAEPGVQFSMQKYLWHQAQVQCEKHLPNGETALQCEGTKDLRLRGTDFELRPQSD